MSPLQSPERGPASGAVPERTITSLPGKPQELSALVETVDMMMSGEVRETEASSASEQWSGASGTQPAVRNDDGAVSPRDYAIRAIPAVRVMQRQISKHITKEVRILRREANSIIRLKKPGEAYRLAEIYARIRQLNGLLAQLWDASLDVIKRLFIRIFIDKQPVV